MDEHHQSLAKSTRSRIARSRAAAFALALVGLVVILGSQGILRQKSIGLRSHPTRRLKAPKDLLDARLSRDKSDALREETRKRSRDEWLRLSSGSADAIRPPRTGMPALAALELAQPAYLRRSDDPNTHTGPPA